MSYRLTSWIDARTIARYNRILELSGMRPYPDVHGAYILNLVDQHPNDRAVVAAALEQATNPRVETDDLQAIDESDLRSAPSIGDQL